MYIPILNTLRGVAALAVVLFHFIFASGYINDSVLRSIFNYGELGVTVFFVISGIVIPLTMINSEYQIKDFYSFFKKRIIRVEIPFFASIILSISYLIVREFIPSTTGQSLFPSLELIIYNIFYLVPFVDGAKWINPVYWTLAIEFQYYLALSALMPLLIQKKASFRIFFYLLVTGSSVFVPIQLFLWAPIFMAGIVYILFIKEIINKTEFITVLIICTIMIFLHHSIDILLTVIVTLFIVHIFTNYNPKVGSFFGEISYSLYLIHIIIGTSFINLMSHFFTDPYQKCIVLIMSLFISIFSAYIFNLYIEKPSKKLSSKVKYSKEYTGS